MLIAEHVAMIVPKDFLILPPTLCASGERHGVFKCLYINGLLFFEMRIAGLRIYNHRTECSGVMKPHPTSIKIVNSPCSAIEACRLTKHRTIGDFYLISAALLSKGCNCAMPKDLVPTRQILAFATRVIRQIFGGRIRHRGISSGKVQ